MHDELKPAGNFESMMQETYRLRHATLSDIRLALDIAKPHFIRRIRCHYSRAYAFISSKAACSADAYFLLFVLPAGLTLAAALNLLQEAMMRAAI